MDHRPALCGCREGVASVPPSGGPHADLPRGAAAARANEEEAQHMKDVQSGAWVAADTMAFDKVVAPPDLRNEIIEALHS
jgi:hypothetical protein